MTPSALPYYGPKKADDPNIGMECIACGGHFKAGDYTALIQIGPGGDPKERAKAALGHAYNPVAFEAHYACVTGNSIPPGVGRIGG